MRLLERAVAAVAEEPRRAEGVGDEEVGKAVAVDVARRRGRSRGFPTPVADFARPAFSVTSVKWPVPVVR